MSCSASSLETQGVLSSASSHMAILKLLSRGTAVCGFKNLNPFTESDPFAHRIHAAMPQGHKAAYKKINPAYVASTELLGGQKISYQSHTTGNKQRNQSPVTAAQGKVQGTCVVMARVHLG